MFENLLTESKKAREEVQKLWQEVERGFRETSEKAKAEGMGLKEYIRIRSEELSYYIEEYKGSFEKRKEYAKELRDLKLANIQLVHEKQLEAGHTEAYLMQQSADFAKEAMNEYTRDFGTLGEKAKLAITESVREAKQKVAEETEGFPFSKEEMGGVKDSLETNLGDTLGDIINKTKSTKAAFRDMGDAIIQDIGRIVTRMVAMEAVQLALGGIGMMFGEGGIMPGHFEAIKQYAQGGVLSGQFMPITPMQHGGIYSRPTLGLIAETGTPEAVVPLKGGGIPVELKEKPQRERPTYIVNAFSEEFMQQQINKALSQNAEVILNMVQQDIVAGGSTYQLIRSMR